jgi:deoxyhypusine synthase
MNFSDAFVSHDFTKTFKGTSFFADRYIRTNGNGQIYDVFFSDNNFENLAETMKVNDQADRLRLVDVMVDAYNSFGGDVDELNRITVSLFNKHVRASDILSEKYAKLLNDIDTNSFLKPIKRPELFSTRKDTLMYSDKILNINLVDMQK